VIIYRRLFYSGVVHDSGLWDATLCPRGSVSDVLTGSLAPLRQRRYVPLESEETQTRGHSFTSYRI
jgi:hypothetical protein